MSKPSKSLSGLKTVTRDWSNPQLSQSSDSGLIDWPPTPPKADLTPAEKRLQAIKDALAEPAMPFERVLTDASSQVINKRPTSPSQQLPTAKKRRQLPSGWNDSSEHVGLASLSSSTWKAKLSSSTVTTKSTPAPKSSAVNASGPAQSSKASNVATVFLSSEQTQILKLVQENYSVFYTGSAGTGKSVLLREIIKAMRRKHVKSPDAVAITASTGIAACNIGGVTIHSFAGIGLGIESAEDLVKKIRKNKKASSRWLRTKVLIIDEVSMIDGDLFDKLEHIGSKLRNKPEPFGGIQIIVTGDFFQLPPVNKSGKVKFAFEAQAWNKSIKRTFNLTKVFRQRDEEFVHMLNEMRFGQLSDRSIAKFKSLSREVVYEDGLGATELFPRREDVDRSNSTRISRLSKSFMPFKARDGGVLKDQQREKMLANFMAPAILNLCVDAQVMLIKNFDETLVNGTIGKVVDFTDLATFTRNGGEILGGGIDPRKMAATSSTEILPVVEFSLVNGDKRIGIIQNETWKVESSTGEVQVSRVQLPLILSWAMSIHKAQGQTLDRVKVDLGKVFEKGQAYVALSRATCLNGLQVLNFDPNKVKAHPKVAEWSKTLEIVTE